MSRAGLQQWPSRHPTGDNTDTSRCRASGRLLAKRFTRGASNATKCPRVTPWREHWCGYPRLWKTRCGLEERQAGDSGGGLGPSRSDPSGHKSGSNGSLWPGFPLFPTHSDFTPVSTQTLCSAHTHNIVCRTQPRLIRPAAQGNAALALTASSAQNTTSPRRSFQSSRWVQKLHQA